MTGPATVSDPMITNTAMAIASSAPESPAWAIDAAAEAVRARFLGLAPESAAPSTSDLAGVKVSIVAIHLGISASSPFFGRDFHCLAAMARNRTPTATWTQLTPVVVELSGSEASPVT